MLVINRKRRIQHPLLFSGLTLDRHVCGYQETATIVGKVFEGLTEVLLGGERRTTDCNADICPDVMHDEFRLMIESKATSSSSQMKINQHQISKYLDAESSGYEVTYALWTYMVNRLTATYGTVGAIIEALIANIGYLVVVDVSLIHALLGVCPGSCRVIDSWGRDQTGRDLRDPALLVYQTYLRRLRDAPYEVLQELGLDAVGYDIRQHAQTGVVIQYDGQEWETGQFRLTSITRSLPF